MYNDLVERLSNLKLEIKYLKRKLEFVYFDVKAKNKVFEMIEEKEKEIEKVKFKLRLERSRMKINENRDSDKSSN